MGTERGRRAVAGVVALIVVALGVTGVAHASGPAHYCVQDGASPPTGDPSCPVTGFDATYDTVGQALAAVKADGMSMVTGDTVTIEPGTYTENAVLDGMTGVTVQGVAGGPEPVITAASGDTFQSTGATTGATIRHLEFDNTSTGNGNRALALQASATVNDVTVKGSSDCAEFHGPGGYTVANLTADSIVNPARLNAAPCVEVNSTTQPTNITGMVVNAPDYGLGLEVYGTTASTTVDRSAITAEGHAMDGAFGALTLVNALDTTVSHSVLSGGTFGATVGNQSVGTKIENSLITAAGPAGGGEVGMVGIPSVAVLALTGGDATLRNVTAFAADPGSLGVEVSDAIPGVPAGPSTMTISNSIIHGARADVGDFSFASVTSPPKGQLDISYSDYKQTANDGSFPGPGNVSGDAMFVNPTLGGSQNFHLKAGSPALDSGTAVAGGDTDLDGHARPDVAGTAPDMGAYESSFVRAAPTCSPVHTTVPGKPVKITFACTPVTGLANTYATTSSPVHGKLSGLDPARGTVIYTPTAGYAGNDSFTYTATNAVGSSAPATVQLTVRTAPPSITHAHESHKRWAETNLLASISAAGKPPLGTKFTFVLNEPARVTFTFKLKHGKGGGGLSFNGHAGMNKVLFFGQLSPTKTLGRGSYTLRITATNSHKQASKPVKLKFTIV